MPETDSPSKFPRDTQPPAAFNIMLAGAIIALITFFAGLISFLSVKQAPSHVPVIEQNTK